MIYIRPFTYNVWMNEFASATKPTSDSDPRFPRAILHVDGDSFFVSCELTRRPGLRGYPVVTGLERGIASAMSPEAKAKGITRGMRLSEMRRLCPEVIILPSDYFMYGLYARRMYDIVRRYAHTVEEYSIDECFADLTRRSSSEGGHVGIGGPGNLADQSYEEIARAIQADLHASLGMTFSVGLAVNKVTAKIASKWNKPAGFVVIPIDKINNFLEKLPVGKIWGIGSSTTVYLKGLRVETALDLARKDRTWVDEYCDKPLREIYEELRGNFVKELGVAARDPISIQRTRTFRPTFAGQRKDKDFLWSQLSHHVEEACGRLRSSVSASDLGLSFGDDGQVESNRGLVASRVSFFLKTQSFEYIRAELSLPEATSSPAEILRAMKPHFEDLFRPTLLYRATGVTLSGLVANSSVVQTLFRESFRNTASRVIHQAIDKLDNKFGQHSVFLGSSLKALKSDGDLTREAKAKQFNIIYLGQVS